MLTCILTLIEYCCVSFVRPNILSYAVLLSSFFAVTLLRINLRFCPHRKRSLNNLDHWIAEDACKCHHENFSNRKSILSRVTAKKKDKRTACDAMFGLTKETPRYSINVRMRVSELAQTRAGMVEKFPLSSSFG